MKNEILAAWDTAVNTRRRRIYWEQRSWHPTELDVHGDKWVERMARDQVKRFGLATPEEVARGG